MTDPRTGTTGPGAGGGDDDGPAPLPEGPGYPPHWEADVVASDGGTVHLRPIRPADAEALSGLVARSSERTRYLRFFGPYPRIPDRDLHRFVHVDHVRRVALVAVLGGEIIAVGRYDTLPDDESGGVPTAEVAFLVEDAHQGRGLGSILLEHLAAAARERGLRQFSAEVLAENGGMIRTFLHAGYQPRRSYADGVVHLVFSIAPTDSAQAVAFEREQRAESRSIGRLLTPRSVAVIGASNDRRKLGYAILRNLLDYGFEGPLYPVNPEAAHVAGVPAYRSVLDVPGAVDLAVLTVPPAAVAEVAEQCRGKGVRGLVVVTGGLADPVSGDQAPTAAALVARARAEGMRVIGPNGLGVVNTDPRIRLNASLVGSLPQRGRVGMFCQSGALGITLLAAAAERGVGLSTFVSAGNRADVSGNDLLQFWATDPDTDVVLLYLESFGNPRKFARLARRLARDKPVVAVKSGRHSGTAVRGLAATTVALPESSVQALFEAAGVVRVDTVEQMFDVAVLLAGQPVPTGPRVRVVGNSSALALLVADACLGHGLHPAADPTDIGPAAGAAELVSAVVAARQAGDADAIVVGYVPPVGASADAAARELATAVQGWPVPVVTTFPGPAPTATVTGTGALGPVGLPSYPSPERAVLALARAVRYGRWRARPVGTLPELTDIDADAAAGLVLRVLRSAPEGRELTTAETARLLAAYGVVLLQEHPAEDVAGAEQAAERVGYPVALKSTRRTLRHRADLGGVRLGIGGPDELRAAYAAMPGDGRVVVQPMAPPGVATTIGVVDDPGFGGLVSFGVAGVATELLGDRAHRALPLSDLDAAELIREVRAWPLLAGYRGSRPVDVAALQDLVLRVARLAEDRPELLALELEPVVVSTAGLTVAGATARVGPPTSRAPLGPRRLSHAAG